MTRYIPGYCEPQLPPPYKFSDVSLWCFPLIARYDALQRVVDKYLNVAPPGDAGFRFRPMGLPKASTSLIYLTVLHYGSMACSAPPYNHIGYQVQNELYFAIPVVRWEGVQPRDVGIFNPFIFVDNPWSVVCGNMVLGYPKQMAWLRMPQSFESPYPIEMEAPAFDRYSPDSQLTRQRVVEINAAGGDSQPGSAELWPFGDVEALFGSQGPASLPDAVFQLVQQAVRIKAYSAVQLNQVLDAVNPTQACYQAVVNFTMGLDALSAVYLLAPAVIDLYAYASLPIGKELGLSYVGGKLHPVLPFGVRCDFNLKAPKVLYTATAH